jgi:hypothetical protein
VSLSNVGSGPPGRLVAGEGIVKHADSDWRSAGIAPRDPEIRPENLKGHLLYV